MGRSFENRKTAMAKTAGMKTKIYGKYGRELYVVAKQGGVDPNGNLALRSLIERAKKDQVPAHVIDKAIAKAAGGGGEDFARAQYEGSGPGGIKAIIECLTDNPTRTIADVRNCFTKTKSKIGSPGSVTHLFDYRAIFGFSNLDEDTVLEALLEADVDVAEIENEEGKLFVFAPANEYGKAKSALEAAFPNIEFDVDDIQWVPQNHVAITEEEDKVLFEKFIDMLNDLDDVQNVYTNAE